MTNPQPPKWLAAWLNYPHGPLMNRQARELSRYAHELEDRVRELQAQVSAAENEARIPPKGKL